MAKRKSITMDTRIRELYEKYPIMQQLEEEQVCGVESEHRKVLLLERCDDFFAHELTEEEVVQLSEFFAELANYMKEQN